MSTELMVALGVYLRYNYIELLQQTQHHSKVLGCTANYPFPLPCSPAGPLGYQLQSVEIRCQELLLPNISDSESGWDQHPQLSVQHQFTYRMNRIGN